MAGTLWKRLGVALAATFLAATVAAAAIPGPQRILAPGLYGLTEIAPDIYSDRPGAAADHLAMLGEANGRVRAFFGDLKSKPKFVLCSAMPCERSFGSNNKIAVSYAWLAVRIPPMAMADRQLGVDLITHERTHTELLWRWGATALWDERFPSWFNEGLAVHVSGDHRLRRPFDQETKQWIRGAKSLREWGNFVDARGFEAAYGAAGALVNDIDAQIGRNGLLMLINRTLAGEEFETALAELTGSNPAQASQPSP